MNKTDSNTTQTLALLAVFVVFGIYMFMADGGELVPQVDLTGSATPAVIESASTPALTLPGIDTMTIVGGVLLVLGVGLIVLVVSVKRKMPAKVMAKQGPATIDDLLFDEPVPVTPRPQPVQRTLPFFPQDIYETVNGVLSSRGGRANDGYNFWVESDRCAVNPLAWTLGFDYRDGCDPATVQKYMLDMQSRLCKAGYDTSVRIDAKRCIIEVGNPNPPTFRLRQHWQEIKALPTNERSCVPGVEAKDGRVGLKPIYMRGERAGTMLAGRTGSGKTQVLLSSILTQCLLNSPQRMALIIGDIKGDTKPLDSLPHLAMPILTEVDDIANMLGAVVAEMVNRQRRAARGDRGFNGKTIAIYLDEVTTTLLSAGDRADEMSKAIQQLTLVGRSLGIIVVMATQRIYDLPSTEVYSNCGRRFGLKMNTASDSFALTGGTGTKLHELRGRGAFEIFDAGNNEGERGQGFFVADPEEEGYTDELQWYVEEIKQQWPGQRSYYTVDIEPDDNDTDTPRPVTRYYEGFDNEPVDEWQPESADGAANVSREEEHAEKILGAYRVDELFDANMEIRSGMLAASIRAIYGPQANTGGSNRTNAIKALEFIKHWESVATTTVS